MIDLKSIARLWIAVPALLMRVTAVACAGDQSAPGAAPTDTQPAATSAPAAASTEAPALSPTAPAFRAAADSTPAPAATVAVAPQPEGQPKVDTLVIAVDQAAGEINLPWGGTADHQQQMHLVMDVLADIDAERNVWVPQLAASCELSEDGTRWTFQLIEGVEFHGGWGKFTAADFFHGVSMLTRDDSLIRTITEWRAIDLDQSVIVSDHELVIQLGNPNPDYLFYIAPRGGGLMISKAFWDAESLDGYNRDMIGTGLYRFAGRELGVDVDFERLPEHWRLNGQGGNPAPADWPMVNLRWISEPGTRNAGLLPGEIHLTELNRELADTVVTDHGMKVIQSNFPGNQLWGVFQGLYSETPAPGEWSTWEQPWMFPDFSAKDPRVRETLNRAVDKELLPIDTLFGGRVTVSPVGEFYPNLTGWDETWVERFDDLYGYDPDRARELLAEAGYGPDNPAEMKMIVMNIFGFSESAGLMQAVGVMFADIGVDVTYEEWEFGNYYSAWTKKEPESVGFWVEPPALQNGLRTTEPVQSLQWCHSLLRNPGVGHTVPGTGLDRTAGRPRRYSKSDGRHPL